ncbi:hypothetical protein [Gorillibacterium sp. sgz5001074]|uniref:hypothetical protein n=1 Tax=Gorillibacterium sp. sgz5001074 TaxID=3446695 RepID=UPI003F67F3C2
MKQEFSVAEIARNLRLSDSTVHRRIQLAIDLGWIQPEKKGSRYKYTKRDLCVIDNLEEIYKRLHSDEKILELFSKIRTQAPKGLDEAIFKLTDEFNVVTQDMLINTSDVTYALQQVVESNQALSRQLHNIQDKLDALSIRLIRVEDKLYTKYNHTQ